jgi:hypothetical protein
MTPLATPVLQGHVPLHPAGGRLELRSTCNRQQELALLEEVEDTGGICFIGFTRTIRPGWAIVADGLAVHQTDTGATAFEPFIERWPGDTGGLQGDQQTSTMVVAQMMLEGVLQELASLPGVGKCQVAAADACRRTSTSMVFGLAHLDSNKEQVSLRHIRFPRVGVSSILCQSHGTLLLG